MSYIPPDEMILIDIRNSAQRIQRYASGMTFERFQGEDLVQSAILHQFMVMGEAVRRLSEGFKNSHSEIPWSRIGAMRNVLIHRYDDVNLEIVWSVVENNLADLIAALDTLIPEEPKD